jgi:hypothetical protein
METPMVKYGQSKRTMREVVENKIKQAIGERAPMKRNLIVRMGDELHDQLAELARKMSEEMPGKRVTVSNVARIILEHGVRARKNTQRAKDLREREEMEEEGGI